MNTIRRFTTVIIVGVAVMTAAALYALGFAATGSVNADAAVAPTVQTVSLRVATTNAVPNADDCNSTYGFSYYCNIDSLIVTTNPVFKANGEFCERMTNRHVQRGMFSLDSDTILGAAQRLNPGQSESVCGRLARGHYAHAFARACFGGGEVCYSGGVRSPRITEGVNHSVTAANGRFTRSGNNPYGCTATLQVNNGAHHNFHTVAPHGLGTISAWFNPGQLRLIEVSYSCGARAYVIDARYIRRPAH